jgi:maltokinase
VPEDERGRERLAHWVREAPRAELLPPRRAEAAGSATGAELLDALPLGDRACLAVAAIDQGVVVVPAVDDGGAFRRARAGDGAFAAIAAAMQASRPGPRFAGSPTGASAAPARGIETAIDVDQSNDSVVVDGTMVVKLFPVTAPGPQPGLELPSHLAEVGFASIPEPRGALRWVGPRAVPRDEVVLATAAAYLPGARDGWAWYLDRLLAWMRDDVSDDEALEPATSLGGVTAAMHAALATPSNVIPEPERPADASSATAWRDRAIATAREAVTLTGGDEGRRLAERLDAVMAAFEPLAEAGGTPTTRVHGDYHVGQVLEWDMGYAITDFDGVPTAPAADRGAFDAPSRDVAAFACSIDHLGRVAALRHPDAAVAIDDWIARSRAAFIGSYREGLASLGARRLLDASLLRPFSIAQECHEYVYAARFLPRWRAVADLAMQALIPA